MKVPFELQHELRTLAARYASAADHKDRETFARCFVPDGVVSVVRKPGAEPVVRQGYDELLTVFNTLDPFIRTYHHLGQSLYRYETDESTDVVLGEVYCVAHHVPEGEPLTDNTYYIRYEDRYVRAGEVWRFARRDLHQDFKSVTSGVHDVHMVTPSTTVWA